LQKTVLGGCGLAVYDGTTFSNYATEVSLLDTEIWGMPIDNDGIVWVGSIAGVSKFNGTRFEPFIVPKAKVIDPQSILSENRIGDILIDTKGHVWFATDGYGITKFDGTSFEFYTKENGLPDNNIGDIFEDSQGNIWIGTFYGGVSKYDGTSFRNFTKEGIIEGIETYNFSEDANGNVWFSAEKFGVYRYDGTNFTKFTTEDGLTSNGVQSIYTDQKGQVWFCTWKGISMYDGKRITDVSEKEFWAR
jgi:ligand-binding sensor domain-containing protein